MGCSQITEFFDENDNEEFFCDLTESESCFETFKEFKRNCTNSVTIVDAPYNTYKYTLREKRDHCYFKIEILNSNLPNVRGSKLYCKIPFTKLDFFSTATDIDYFKYCEGSYKDRSWEITDQIFS